MAGDRFADEEAAAAESRRVRALTGALEEARSELRYLARVVAHDLSAPVRAVQGYAELLSERIEEDLDSTASRYLQRVREGGDRLRSFLDDIARFAQVDDAKTTFLPVRLSDALRQAVSRLEEHGLPVDAIDVPGELPQLNADFDGLVELLFHVLSNALTFQTDAPRVRLTATQRGQEWHFAVSDNGIGVPEASREDVFRLFRRLNGPGEFPGNGAGLAISRRIVRLHKGRIWLEGAPGEGTTCRFVLPADA